MFSAVNNIGRYVMISYNMSNEEKDFLKQYDISQFERPSVATDMAIYSIMQEGANKNYRKLPQKALKVLLIKRGTYPYKDCWALPGGFCQPGEDVHETAKRELYEETNVENAYLSLAGTFGEFGRDPRGWIISNTFLALIDGNSCELRAGTDAWEAKWFAVDLKKTEVKKISTEDSIDIETLYELKLINEDAVVLCAKVKEYKQHKNYHETVRYEIVEDDNFAFDHAKLILHTLLLLRKNVENNLKIVFDLLPELFTLTQLQNAVELVLDKELLMANFRRKIADYVIETDQVIDGAGHRPAKLFKRNIERFYI